MGKWFYEGLCALGVPVFKITSSPVFLHRGRVPRRGGFLLACNHTSPYDIACLMYAARPRRIDFLSTVEMFKNPAVGFIGRRIDAVPLDRGRVDAVSVRTLVDRMRGGRGVCLFPEARIAPEAESVLHGGKVRRGVGRLAVLSQAPVVPCVVLDSGNMNSPAAYLPLRRTRFAVAFGEPIVPPAAETKAQQAEAERAVDAQWTEAMRGLGEELVAQMPWRRSPAGA